jgi:hypothetical protein
LLTFFFFYYTAAVTVSAALITASDLAAAVFFWTWDELNLLFAFMRILSQKGRGAWGFTG